MITLEEQFREASQESTISALKILNTFQSLQTEKNIYGMIDRIKSEKIDELSEVVLKFKEVVLSFETSDVDREVESENWAEFDDKSISEKSTES